MLEPWMVVAILLVCVESYLLLRGMQWRCRAGRLRAKDVFQRISGPAWVYVVIGLIKTEDDSILCKNVVTGKYLTVYGNEIVRKLL